MLSFIFNNLQYLIILLLIENNLLYHWYTEMLYAYMVWWLDKVSFQCGNGILIQDYREHILIKVEFCQQSQEIK